MRVKNGWTYETCLTCRRLYWTICVLDIDETCLVPKSVCFTRLSISLIVMICDVHAPHTQDQHNNQLFSCATCILCVSYNWHCWWAAGLCQWVDASGDPLIPKLEPTWTATTPNRRGYARANMAIYQAMSKYYMSSAGTLLWYQTLPK